MKIRYRNTITLGADPLGPVIYVDHGAEPGGDGSKERPYSSFAEIQEQGCQVVVWNSADDEKKH